jgi:hypothetical protein
VVEQLVRISSLRDNTKRDATGGVGLGCRVRTDRAAIDMEQLSDHLLAAKEQPICKMDQELVPAVLLADEAIELGEDAVDLRLRKGPLPVDADLVAGFLAVVLPPGPLLGVPQRLDDDRWLERYVLSGGTIQPSSTTTPTWLAQVFSSLGSVSAQRMRRPSVELERVKKMSPGMA